MRFFALLRMMHSFEDIAHLSRYHKCSERWQVRWLSCSSRRRDNVHLCREMTTTIHFDPLIKDYQNRERGSCSDRSYRHKCPRECKSTFVKGIFGRRPASTIDSPEDEMSGRKSENSHVDRICLNSHHSKGQGQETRSEDKVSIHPLPLNILPLLKKPSQ